MTNKRIKRITIIGVISAFAVILSYIEALISFSFFIPGVKLGLANMAVVTILYIYDGKAAITVNFIRIIIIGLLFGNGFSITFSIAGAFTSFLVMWIFKKTDKFTILGVSISGGVFHNIAQLITATIITESFAIRYYFPFLMISGIVTGFVIGIVSEVTLRYLNILHIKKEII